jgi:hypothetical protein
MAHVDCELPSARLPVAPFLFRVREQKKVEYVYIYIYIYIYKFVESCLLEQTDVYTGEGHPTFRRKCRFCHQGRRMSE